MEVTPNTYFELLYQTYVSIFFEKKIVQLYRSFLCNLVFKCPFWLGQRVGDAIRFAASADQNMVAPNHSLVLSCNNVDRCGFQG